jgi:hypothetical protein
VTFILVLILLAGCGGNPRPKSVWVHGKVVGPKGKSVGPAVVILWAENSKNNPGASSVCNADGSFSLQCFPGNYKTTVSPIRPRGGTATPPPHGPESAIPDKYQNELTTTLTLKVPEMGADNIILTLK